MSERGPERGSAAAIIVRLRKRNPCMTLKQIGDKVARSKERVRQILSRAGLPTRGLVQPKLRYECPGCGRLLRGPTSSCPTCRMGTFVCENCGNEFQRGVAVQRSLFKRGQKRLFCTKKCVGRFAGTHYGWAVHPPPTVPRLALACTSCGATVYRLPSSQRQREKEGCKRVFCSQRCRTDFTRSHWPKFPCESCGAQVQRRPSDQKERVRRGAKYCSLKCLGRSRRKKRLVFSCAFCGTRVLRSARDQKGRARRGLKHIFCSLKCRGRWWTEGKRGYAELRAGG